MNVNEISKKFKNDFTVAEVKEAVEKVVPISKMAKSDKVIIEDKLMDFLQEFFNGTFDGEPLPIPFEECLIEWRSLMGIIHLYVTIPEGKKDWLTAGIYINGWQYIGKLWYPNVAMDESDRNESGAFHCEALFAAAPAVNAFAAQLTELVNACKDVLMYAYIYVHANLDNEEVVKVEMVDKGGKGNGKKGNGKGGKNKPKSPKRETVFVPKRRVVSVKKTDKTTRAMATYVYSRWRVRGYKYTRKDGTEVTVKAHWAYRHFPNQGVEKEGKDYILQKPISAE